MSMDELLRARINLLEGNLRLLRAELAVTKEDDAALRAWLTREGLLSKAVREALPKKSREARLREKFEETR